MTARYWLSQASCYPASLLLAALPLAACADSSAQASGGQTGGEITAVANASTCDLSVLVDQLSPANGQWDSGAATRLSLSLEFESEQCEFLEVVGNELPGTLRLRSSDRRVASSWPVMLRAELAGQTVKVLEIEATGTLVDGYTAARFAFDSGISGVDLAGEDRARATLVIRVSTDQPGAQPVLEGALRVFAGSAGNERLAAELLLAAGAPGL